MNESITFEVMAQVGRKGVWQATLDAEALTLVAVDGDESLQILQADAEKEIELNESGLFGTMLVLNFLKLMSRMNSSDCMRWVLHRALRDFFENFPVINRRQRT